MRTFIIALAGAGTAMLVATPATAQYYGQPYRYERPSYGYHQPYYGYGPQGVRGLEQRIFNVLGGVGGAAGTQERIREEAFRLDHDLRMAGRDGLSPYEARSFDQRISQLERFNGYAARSSNGYRYEHRRARDADREYRRWDD